METVTKRERLYYLDFIRALGTLIIILTHYNAIFLYTNPAMPEKAVLSTTIAGIYIGDFGVALFLIISGAALMYVYKEKLEIKKFYIKRFWNIYPTFWIAFLITFLLQFYFEGGLSGGMEKWRIIFSILGVDHYLGAHGVATFANVGEWFLGFIIIFYLVFPILRLGIIRFPRITAIAAVCLYVLMIYYQPPIYYISLPVLLPLIMFGMYFVQYGKNVSMPVAVLSLVVMIVNAVIYPSINSSVQETYIGVCAFLFLVYVSRFFKWKPIPKILGVICKYSYSIFIVHHIIILYLVQPFDLYTLTRTESYLLCLCCCMVIFPVAVMIHKLQEKVVVLITSK